MTRIVRWWIGLAASVGLVAVAFGNQSGTCVDSANEASSCTSQGSGGLLLLGLVAVTLSAWMLRRAYRARRSGDSTRERIRRRQRALCGMGRTCLRQDDFMIESGDVTITLTSDEALLLFNLLHRWEDTERVSAPQVLSTSGHRRLAATWMAI